MSVAGKAEQDFSPHIYPGGGHDPFALPGAAERTVE